MNYLQGLSNLAANTQDGSIVFSSPFGAAPDVVIAVVENTSADAVKLLITVEVVAKDANGFTYRLSGAPNTTNYKLAWVAGSAAVLFQFTAVGRKLSSLNSLESGILDDDYLPVVHLFPVATSMRLRFAVLKALFPNLVVEPPTDPTDPGQFGQMALGDNFFYLHNGVLWGRNTLQTSRWDLQSAPAAIPAQCYVTPLVQGQAYIIVPFGTPYATTPLINFSFRNLVDGAGSVALSGVQTVGSTTGFRVDLNTAPPSGNYQMVWQASPTE